MEFNNAREMLDYINDNHDLYSRTAEKYVFSYNESGSVCVYDIDEKEAKAIAKKARKSEECWSAFLGDGGIIYDDPSYENYTEDLPSNLICCDELIEYEDWVDTEQYLGEPISLLIQMTVELKQEDVDDIMVGALEGGINYWCYRAEVVEDCYYGEFASEQISRGGSLRLYDSECDKVYALDLEKFVRGFKMWVKNGYDNHGAIIGGEVECGNIDAEDADQIVQFAIFGEVVYG